MFWHVITNDDYVMVVGGLKMWREGNGSIIGGVDGGENEGAVYGLGFGASFLLLDGVALSFDNGFGVIICRSSI